MSEKSDGRTRVDSCQSPVSDGRGLDALAGEKYATIKKHIGYREERLRTVTIL